MKRIVTIVFYSRMGYDYIYVDDERVYCNRRIPSSFGERCEYPITFISQPSIQVKMGHYEPFEIILDGEDEINLDDYL
jgi:hypothetical protein